MKKLLALSVAAMFFLHSGHAQTSLASAKINTLSPYYTFTAKGAPLSTLTASKPEGSFSTNNTQQESFTMKLSVNLQPFKGDQVLAEIPGLLSIKLRQADPNDRHRQNYPAAAMPDGTVPVLEAAITLHSPGLNLFSRVLEVGHPLAALKNPWGKHEITVHLTKSHWTIYVDDELMDNDFVVGFPHWWFKRNWKINPAVVSQANLYLPGLKIERNDKRNIDKMPGVQYWTPRGHNAWVGDVATIFHDGRYHVFYLYDRRHHYSKMGQGGHYFEHISTTDFKTWTEHEAATPIEEQWETFGTGTPFVYKNRLHISYGLHTSRIFPDSLTYYPRMMEYYNKNKVAGSYKGDLNVAVPSGATYSVSQDNISNFKKSGVLFHFSENPSVFTTPEGKLKMYANFKAKGTWESDNLESGWHATNESFPLGGDCTFNFVWGKYEYVVGGFVNLWRKPVGGSEDTWVDLAAQGKDFYNGSNVPSVSPIGNGRYIMAGWMPITGWGGPLLIHELVQYPDGRIGTKWMKEVVPAVGEAVEIAKVAEPQSSFSAKDENFILTFDVVPQKKKAGKIGLSFLPSSNSDQKGCELQINTGALTAQYADAVNGGYADSQKSLRTGGNPSVVGNYAIENINGVDKPFTVRILVKANAKLGGTIIDTEIAGQNTLVTYRNKLNLSNIAFNLSDINVKNVKVLKVIE
jgi:beta-fructofuranosidase